MKSDYSIASQDLSFAPAQALLQYFTFSQSRSHFLRQLKGLPHEMQILEGRLFFFTPRML